MQDNFIKPNKKGILSGCLISALKDGFGWCRFTARVKDASGVHYNSFYCPVSALIGKLRESFYWRLNMFMDWTYTSSTGCLTCTEMKDVKIVLIKDRNSIAAEIQKKVNKRLSQIVGINRQEAIASIDVNEGIGEEIEVGAVYTLED